MNARDERGWSVLHVTAAWGAPENIQTLIDAGADVNARDKNRWTPLHNVAQWGTPEIIQVLIDAGAVLG